jgi:hypothetical protein
MVSLLLAGFLGSLFGSWLLGSDLLHNLFGRGSLLGGCLLDDLLGGGLCSGDLLGGSRLLGSWLLGGGLGGDLGLGSRLLGLLDLERSGGAGSFRLDESALLDAGLERLLEMEGSLLDAVVVGEDVFLDRLAGRSSSLLECDDGGGDHDVEGWMLGLLGGDLGCFLRAGGHLGDSSGDGRVAETGSLVVLERSLARSINSIRSAVTETT